MHDDDKTEAAAFDAGREAYREDRNAEDWIPRWVDTPALREAFLHGWQVVPRRDGVYLREMGLQAEAQADAHGWDDDDTDDGGFEDDDFFADDDAVAGAL